MKELRFKELKMIFSGQRSFAKWANLKTLTSLKVWPIKNSTETSNKIWCLHMSIMIQGSSCNMQLWNSRGEGGQELADINRSIWVSMKLTSNNLPSVVAILRTSQDAWLRRFKREKFSYQSLWLQRIAYNRGPYPCPEQTAYLINHRRNFERAENCSEIWENQISIYLNW